MIRALGDALSRFSARWVPDPFVIAIGLTIVTIVLAWGVTGTSPDDLIGYWGGRLEDGEVLPKEMGLWRLLTFGMQMCLILVTGHALASSKPVRRLIGGLAGLPGSAKAAVAMTAAVSILFGLINWGLGLIVGALLAREVALSTRRRGIRVHYPLLGAAGYTGLMVWHGGLSGSATFSVTQESGIKAVFGEAAANVTTIPLDDTVWSALNLVTSGLLLLAVPAILVLMLPKQAERVVEIDPSEFPDEDAEPEEARPRTPARWLEDSPLLAVVLGGMALYYLVEYLRRIGIDRVDLNSINLFFLALGLFFHASPRRYANAIAEGTRSCSGIILQFPLYAGIMGIMALSGLVELIADGIISVASAESHGPLTFFSAGVVNLFVPSGGGQWAIQGEIVMRTAQELGVDHGKAVLAFCYGDGWSNMLQPFWALPLLGITRLKASDLIGYTGALMILVIPLYIGCLMLF